MYESRKQSPLPRALYIRRVVAHFTLALAYFRGLILLL